MPAAKIVIILILIIASTRIISLPFLALSSIMLIRLLNTMLAISKYKKGVFYMANLAHLGYF